MGAVVSCITGLFRAVGSCIMAVISGVGGILMAIISGVVSFLGIIVNFLTCGTCGGRSRGTGRSHGMHSRRSRI